MLLLREIEHLTTVDWQGRGWGGAKASGEFLK
jgi:hypothetical protein